MKYFKRLKIYKSANVTFDAELYRAYSYDWWIFIDSIGGKVVFNDYTYSPSTGNHQRKVKRLLDELGIEVDLYIHAPKGLQDISSAVSYYEGKIDDLKTLINNPKSRETTNIKRQEQINEYVSKIEEVSSLMKHAA